MNLHYISPSLIPSRAANSVHVIHQCRGFEQEGCRVTLYAKRAIEDESRLPESVKESYGVDVSNWNLVTYFSESARAMSLMITLIALPRVLFSSRSDMVLTRNLYAAFFLSLIHRKILFETHQLESGVRKWIQKWIIQSNNVRTVMISKSLAHYLELHHNIQIDHPIVLHDAAPEGIRRLQPENRRGQFSMVSGIPLAEASQWEAVCGYFGQLYAGRGIEIIEEMAASRPDCLFVVYGGSQEEVEQRTASAPPNLRFLGHMPHPVARAVQASVDLLLMPYQVQVSIGVNGHDTARWMSPMKMFEYLAAGVPVISSDLPVLREVLKNGVNAMLVAPDNVDEWLSALDYLVNHTEQASIIGQNAHELYLSEYTWSRRATALIEGYKAE